jgi:hypothetical protein
MRRIICWNTFIIIYPYKYLQKNSKKLAPSVTRPTTPRIYYRGRDILCKVRFQERRIASRCRARQLSGCAARIVPPMTVIALLTVALLGDGFMLYALFHWMRDDAPHPH